MTRFIFSIKVKFNLLIDTKVFSLFMSTELLFIYDSHCPWSYATTKLVRHIIDAYPKIQLQLLHCAYFDGGNSVKKEAIFEVEELSDIKFSQVYKAKLNEAKDSTLTANLLTWVQRKSSKHGLSLLENLQEAHFQHGTPLTSKEDVIDLIKKHKLSPPEKTLQSKRFTKDAEFSLGEIEELQEIIGTNAIPALLLAHNEQLILLNHNFYLDNPDKIVDAVKIELDKKG